MPLTDDEDDVAVANSRKDKVPENGGDVKGKCGKRNRFEVVNIRISCWSLL